jgi:hypothetical protein
MLLEALTTPASLADKELVRAALQSLLDWRPRSEAVPKLADALIYMAENDEDLKLIVRAMQADRASFVNHPLHADFIRAQGRVRGIAVEESPGFVSG